MKKINFIRIVSLSLIILFSLSTLVCADGLYYPTVGEETNLPEISASAYALMDTRTGELLYSNNENYRLPIASVTKIMTALVVLENAKLDDVVTVTADSCGIEGSSVYLYEGEKISVRDLLYALMLESANDAAVCLSMHVAGSIKEFSKMMNEKAEELGLHNSHFNNPHGLEDPEHYSTAYDMCVVWSEAMSNSTFRQIVGTKNYKIDLNGDEGYRYLSNHNKLLKSYEYCIGGKTGFTKTAGRCLVTGAKKDDLELVMVTLNAPDDWSDHEKMLDFAMNQFSKVEVASAGAYKFDLAVVGGKENKITLSNIETLELSVRDLSKLTSRVECPRFTYAPVLTTDKPVGKVSYYYADKKIGEVQLYPTTTVKLEKKDNFIKRFFNIFLK